MSRSVSDNFKSALAAQETSEAFLVLLEIDHDDLASPIRISSDAENTTSNGEVFVAYPFQIVMPTDEMDSVPIAKLVLDNIDRVLISTIRTITTPPTVRIMVVLSSDPDTVEIDLPGFELKDISYDASQITAQLTVESYLNEPFPGDKFMPTSFPGLF